MYSQADKLPADSRVWIYQSNRKLTSEEVNQIETIGRQFVDEWTAHNQTLLASFEVRYNTFLIFMIDQKHASASGCSIDKSVHLVQQLEKQFGISLLDRMIVAYKDKDEVLLAKMNEFNDLINREKINSDTIVFNNLVDTKSALDTNWEIPLDKSWHKQLAR